MRQALLFVCFCLSAGVVIAQKKTTDIKAGKNGYSISVKITPLKNTRVYLYNYYGKADRFQMADSALLNEKSEGVFKGATKLHGGIYILVTDRRVRMMDLLMEDDQEFSIVADTSQPDKCEVFSVGRSKTWCAATRTSCCKNKNGFICH
jgi:hypothetical protein